MAADWSFRRDRRSRLYVVAGVFCLALGLAALSIRDVLLKWYDFTRMGYIILGVLPGALGLIGVMYLLLAYLLPRQSIEVGDVSLSLDDQPTTISPALGIPAADRTESSVSIDVHHPKSTEATVGEGLNDFLDARGREIFRLFGNTQRRLRNEIDALGYRANLNLVFGVAITIIGVVVLIYLITRPHPDFPNVAGVLSHYIPRLSTVALIEAFAYFFLNLYKANLSEIKYYQNERTSATSLQIAWTASLGEEKNRTEAYVIRKLAAIDRNACFAIPEKAQSGELDLSTVLEILTKAAAKAGKGNNEKD